MRKKITAALLIAAMSLSVVGFIFNFVFFPECLGLPAVIVAFAALLPLPLATVLLSISLKLTMI